MSPSQFTFSSAFILGLTGFALHRYHLLSALLCLEGMMLSLFTAVSLWLLQMTFVTLTASPLFILAFSACEASVGLAILVATARTHGTDRLKNMDLLQC